MCLPLSGAQASLGHMQDMANAGIGYEVGGPREAPFYEAGDATQLQAAFDAITRRVLERMVGYAYWPEGVDRPSFRRNPTDGYAVLVSASAAPSLMTRTLARPLRTLRQMARLLSKRPIGSIVIGLQGDGRGASRRQLARARRLGERLALHLQPSPRQDDRVDVTAGEAQSASAMR